MKSKKSISLFFSCMIVSLCVGLVIGLFIMNYYQNRTKQMRLEREADSLLMDREESFIIHEESSIPVSSKEDTITADTTYLILEKDMNTGEIQTKRAEIPDKYIGLNREQLLEQLSDFQANPPLSELEQGFISLDLISFSPVQLEVQMNYQYIEPTGIFYIMAYDHKVVVMLEDKKTVYLSTEIALEQLPSEVQQDIMRGLFIPNEECLYDFLESYTS